MNEKPEEQPDSKCVLLLGGLTQEGVTTKLKSLGYYYHNKRLQSSGPANWRTVAELIMSRRAAGTLVGVFLDMNTSVFDLCRRDEYKEVWHSLVEQLRHVKTTVYVYEKSLMGDFEDATWRDNTEFQASIRSTIHSLQEAGLTLLPFQKHHEVTTSIIQVLEELDAGVLLRLYIPKHRYQSEQFNAFLRLLENYLRTVEKASFSINQRKTDHGLIYIFSSRTDITSGEELNAAIARFQEFMELCEHEAARARNILTAASVAPVEADAILARYGRDYRRLKLDTKHEYEQKLLLLRQRLEGELVDPDFVTALDSALVSHMPSVLSLAGNTGPISINMGNSATLAVATNHIGQLLSGDIAFNEQDNRIISLINEHSEGLHGATLKSALAELKDESTASEARKTAGQKVKGFLYKAASVVGEAAVKGLASYVETLVGRIG